MSVKLLSAPISCQWEVTPKCNYDCIHCYNHWRQSGNGFAIVANKKMVSLYGAAVREILANQVFAVTVTGGEPLIVLDEIMPYLEQLHAGGVQVRLNSNLSILTGEMAQSLKRVGVVSLLVSLPAGKEEVNDRITGRQGSFARTVRGIKIAREAGFPVTVNMVVTKINLKLIYETAKLAASLGIESFAATRASIPGVGLDFSDYALSLEEFRFMLAELLRVKEELKLKVDSLEFYPPCSMSDSKARDFFRSRSCSAAKTNCTIGYDASVRPCSHATTGYGDIRDGLRQAWLAMGEWRSGELLPVGCKTCATQKHCGGGCRVEALLSKGSLNDQDPYCDYSQLPLGLPSRKLDPVGLSEEYVFHSELKSREENFGGILFISPSRWAPVKKELYELAYRAEGGIITPRSLATVLGVSENDAATTIAYLCAKKILVERREKYHDRRD